MHRRFLGRGGAAVDAGVSRDQVRLRGRLQALVLGYEAARAWVRTVVQQQAVDVLVGRFRIVGNVFQLLVIRRLLEVRLFLSQQLIEALAPLLLGGGGAKATRSRPVLGRNDASVEWVVPWIPVQRVGGVLDLIVLEVS